MAGETGSSSSSSSSRLSPLAPPFTISRSTRPPKSTEHPTENIQRRTSGFTTSLEDADDHPLHTNPFSPQYSSPVYIANTPLPLHNPTCSTLIPLDDHFLPHSSALFYNAQMISPSFGSFSSNFKHNSVSVAASSANNSMLKQGLPAAESSQACLVTSASWCGKCTGILGRESEFGSRGTEQIDTECLSFPVKNPNNATSKTLQSSVICSTAIPQESFELQLPYTVPVVNALRHDNANTASNEQCFSPLYSYTACPTGVHSSENNSFPAQVFGSSRGSAAVLAPRPVLSENYNSSGNVAVNNNENSSIHTTSSLMGPNVPQNAKGKEVFRDESMLRKCKETKDHIFVESSLTNRGEFSNEKPVSDVAMDLLLLEKSNLRVTHPNLLDDCTYKSHCDERGVSVENSSEMFDKYDSEVDSPCWKGTQSRCSLFEVSGTVNSQLPKNELEACKKLNPLAPQFFPGSAEGNLYYRGNECCGGDLLAFQKSMSLDVKSSSKEHGLGDAVEAECPSKVSSGVGAQDFDDIHDPTKECATLNNSNITSEINYSQMVKPSIVEYNFRSNEKFVIGANVSCSGNGFKDAAQNGSFCVPFLAREHVSGVPSSGGNIPSEIMETPWGACNSLSTPPIDVQIVVNALHNLSELLIQNCSSDLNSLKEHDHDILQHVINNLYLCIRRRGGLRTPVSETPHPVTSYCPQMSIDFQQGTDMGCQVTRTKAVSVQHKLDNRSEPEKQNSFSTVYSERNYRVLDSFPSSSDAGIENGDDTGQVVEKVQKGNHQIEEDTHPQVLLYRNLWLEAEAALCSMKYKDCGVRMKTKMDKCKSDIKYG